MDFFFPGNTESTCRIELNRAYLRFWSPDFMVNLCSVLMFLGAFAKLRKATISSAMSVCPFVRTEKFGSYWTDFD